MKNRVKIYQPDGVNFINENTAITELARGFKFSKGPLWHPEGYLRISDIALKRIFLLYLNGVIHVPLPDSGGMCVLYKNLSDMIGTNGLALDSEENLIFSQQGNGNISKIEKGKNITQLCSSLNGNAFNSANDIVVKSDGAIFFTDFADGLKNQALNPTGSQPDTCLYRFCNNQVSLLDIALKYPQGLCFSKDEKYLFVSSNHPDEKIIYKYELSAEGEIIQTTIFAFMNADGLKLDKHNNVYAATDKGVVILSPDGETLALIETNGTATSIAFGGEEESLLFITTASAVFYLNVGICVQRTLHNSFEKNIKVLDEKEKGRFIKRKSAFSKILGF